jgi:hypothetical protein
VSLVTSASSTNQNWIDASPTARAARSWVWLGLGPDPDSAKFVFGYHAQRLNAGRLAPMGQ